MSRLFMVRHEKGAFDEIINMDDITFVRSSRREPMPEAGLEREWGR